MTPIEELLEVMAALRDPQRGCPWDRRQSFASIAPYTIEEAYEVADAIARGARDELRDELGDLLFQVVFHARMASEEGSFDFDDVARAIVDKMVRRHPHVFAGEEVADVHAQSLAWEEHKRAERAARTGGAPAGALDGVARGLPALTRAAKLQRRAAGVGFDWPAAAAVLPKLEEEVAELRDAFGAGAEIRALTHEMGDVLFTCVNLCRHLGIDPEGALREANLRFETRFRRVESLLAAHGEQAADAGLVRLDELWEIAKAEGTTGGDRGDPAEQNDSE